MTLLGVPYRVKSALDSEQPGRYICSATDVASHGLHMAWRRSAASISKRAYKQVFLMPVKTPAPWSSPQSNSWTNIINKHERKLLNVLHNAIALQNFIGSNAPSRAFAEDACFVNRHNCLLLQPVCQPVGTTSTLCLTAALAEFRVLTSNARRLTAQQRWMVSHG